VTRHPPERFLVELTALPDDVPPVVRLRKFLKRALRAYRLRCVRVESVKEPRQDENVAHNPVEPEREQ
jgi:hypothetical protein